MTEAQQQHSVAGAPAGGEVVLQATGITRVYRDGGREVDVLRGVDLAVQRGEMLSIMGASGSGKSTLLHILGLLDRPSSGRVDVAGTPTDDLSEVALSRLRNRSLGFVYQFHHLLPEFNALDNVAMPLIVRRLPRSQARERAAALLAEVGLSERITHFPGQLSGGERQRVALARALVAEPACVLADEPTGNLDRETAHDMFALLQRLNQQTGLAFIIVTHDPALAALGHRCLHMTQGRLDAEA